MQSDQVRHDEMHGDMPDERTAPPVVRFVEWLTRLKDEGERARLETAWFDYVAGLGWDCTCKTVRGMIAGGLVRNYIESPALFVAAMITIPLLPYLMLR